MTRRCSSPRLAFVDRCWSYMGKTKTSGAQDLSIALPGCVTQSIVIHELLHAVGFAHEQTRPDRDSFVTINWGNVQSGTENNFRLYSTSDVSTFNQPYDMRKNKRRRSYGRRRSVSFSFYLASIMHYRWNAFSKNGQPTVLPKQSGVDRNLLGSSQQMTSLDIQKVKAYYGCT